MSDEDYLGPEITLGVGSGLIDIDDRLFPCPKCGNQLRSEVREQWSSLAETSEAFGFEVTREHVLESGGKLDAFGRVLSAVPYVSCMHCGFDSNAALNGFIRPEPENP